MPHGHTLGQRLLELLFEVRLEVEKVELARRPGHEKENNMLCLRSRIGCGQGILGKKGSQGRRPEAGSGVRQELAAGKKLVQVVHGVGSFDIESWGRAFMRSWS